MAKAPFKENELKYKILDHSAVSVLIPVVVAILFRIRLEGCAALNLSSAYICRDQWVYHHHSFDCPVGDKE